MNWITEFLFAGPLVPRLFERSEIHGLIVFLFLVCGALFSISMAGEIRSADITDDGLQFALGAISALMFGLTGIAWPILSVGIQSSLHYAWRREDDPLADWFFAGSAVGIVIALVLSLGIFWSCGPKKWQIKVNKSKSNK